MHSCRSRSTPPSTTGSSGSAVAPNGTISARRPEFVAGNVSGVVGLQDDIQLTMPGIDPDAVKQAITMALERGARIDADQISVTTQHGTVILTGTVTSWYEHDRAMTAAWSAPGVNDVDDRLTVVAQAVPPSPA
jgi:osmotically-inducible protein OsmY